MGQNSSMGQFTGVSLKLLPPKKIIFNDIDDSDWPMAKSVNISRGDHVDKQDAWWSEIFKMKGPSGLATFGKLKRLVHVLLILP